MKTLSIYRVNKPTTTSGHSITISTTIFGTEEEVEYLSKNCAETIGSGLVQEYSSPSTSHLCVGTDMPKISLNIDKIMEVFEKDLRGEKNE